MDRSRLLGVVLVIVSACAFGSGAIFSKPVYATGVDWLTLLSWRFLFGATLGWLLVLTQPRVRAALRAMSRRALLVALALGVMYTGNAGTYYASLETVPASLAALIVYIYPPIVAVLAARFAAPLRGIRMWAALGLALVGVVLAVGGIDASAPPPTAGLALAIASAVIYAFWIILSARLVGERSGRLASQAERSVSPSETALGATALMMTATMATFWLLALLTGRPVAPALIPADAWPGLLGVGIVATFVAIVTFYVGASRVGAAQAALIATLEPVWTITLAAALLGERLEPIQLGGGVLILAGVVLAQTGTRPRRAEPGSVPDRLPTT
ncbi:MAG TPA: DMT family transporter [Candidatus Limnocylindrales bacterium]|nr:DMT family transporter [Candidatus Limnocylindrales bacterium]